MRKLTVSEFMSLDGVVQGPGGAEEDSSGGFSHGGWHMRYFDDLANEWVLNDIVTAGGLVLGRRTYQIFAAYWPTAGEEEGVIRDPLNTLPKYVASRTLTGPLAWQNATLIQGDLAASVRALKQQDGGDLRVIGSSDLVHSLIEHNLVDEYNLMIDPLILGGGKRLYPDDGTLRPLQLVNSRVTTKGVVLATYASAEG